MVQKKLRAQRIKHSEYDTEIYNWQNRHLLEKVYIPNAPVTVNNQYIPQFMRESGTFDKPIPKNVGFEPISQPLIKGFVKPKTKEEKEKSFHFRKMRNYA